MAKQLRTYLDSPSAGFLRIIVILSVIMACANALAFLLNVIGALFFSSFDNPLEILILTLSRLIEAIAMLIFVVFFRQDHVRRNTKMFAYPVALYSLINLLFIIYALPNWKWDNLVDVISFVLLAMVAADCYYGFKRINISIIALIFTGSCQLTHLIYDLIILITASSGQVRLIAIAITFAISLFNTIPYLIMILYLRERIAIGKRLAAVAE